MPKKKQPESRKQDDPNVMGLRAEVLEQPICQTLESNYMPYAMSVIVSRAIPEIDGFSRRTASCSIPCMRWGFSPSPAQNPPTSSARR